MKSLPTARAPWRERMRSSVSEKGLYQRRGCVQPSIVSNISNLSHNRARHFYQDRRRLGSNHSLYSALYSALTLGRHQRFALILVPKPLRYGDFTTLSKFVYKGT